MPSTKTPDYLLVLVEKKTNYGDRWFSTDGDVIQPVWVLITVYTEIVEYEISNMIFNTSNQNSNVHDRGCLRSWTVLIQLRTVQLSWSSSSWVWTWVSFKKIDLPCSMLQAIAAYLRGGVIIACFLSKQEKSGVKMEARKVLPLMCVGLSSGPAWQWPSRPGKTDRFRAYPAAMTLFSLLL